VSARPIIAWRGHVWRAHKRTFAATDPGGSRLYSGRYNRGLDFFPADQTWPALYCGLSYGVCLAEVTRHLTPELLPTLNQRRFSKLFVELSAVLDCRDVSALGVSLGELFHDTNYELGQELAAAAIRRNCEGLVLPSATRFPDVVLVIFTDSLRPTSRIEVVEYVDPALYVDRP
jgi:RES domain-containing protein